MTERIIEMIQSGNKEHPLVKSYIEGSRFYSDFIDMMKFFENKLKKAEYKGIQKKVENSFYTSDVQEFLQCMCELIVIYYLLRRYSENNFNYEPKLCGGYNPECNFMIDDICVNVEVKTPNYSKRIVQEQTDSLKIFPAERIKKHKEIIQELSNIISSNSEQGIIVEELMRLDNKLKDYLLHSQKKFPKGQQYFNILVIALEIASDLDEWYSYILGENGVFTDRTFIDDDYSNVDAILLCTPVCGIKGWENFGKTNVWKLEETVNILLLDPRKEQESKGYFYFEKGIDIFGTLSRAFLSYQNNLDKTNANLYSNEEGNTGFEYIQFKELDLRICSAFLQSLEH